MPQTMTFSRDIEIRDDLDVFVAGGGPGGFTAAVAAARHGLKVMLVEGTGCFGGMGTAGLVPAFMTFGNLDDPFAAGIGIEIYRKMIASGSPQGIRPEVLKRVYDDLAEEAGFQFRFFTHLVGVEVEGGVVKTAVCWGKSGLHAFRAKVFIDGTGDGDLAVWAGAPFEKGDENGELMPGTLCSNWCKIDWARYQANLKDHPDQHQRAYLEKAIAEGVLSQNDLHLPGIWQTGDSTGGGNINHLFGIDHTDERSITPHMVHGRKLVGEYGDYYRKYVTGFENMELMQTGELPGIRETRRVMGDYVLNLEDFKNRASFDDEIGRYCYPVDIHPKRPDPGLMATFEKQFHEELRYKAGESYGIPYRILTPRKLDNVYVTGRCVSTDIYLQGSIRVMPGCYITGQAAGTAAALAIAGDGATRGVDVQELRRTLKADGCYVE